MAACVNSMLDWDCWKFALLAKCQATSGKAFIVTMEMTCKRSSSEFLEDEQKSDQSQMVSLRVLAEVDKIPRPVGYNLGLLCKAEHSTRNIP